MSAGQSEDDRLIRYLLGDALPEAEQSDIEERYFTDDVYFDRLLAVEDELIDGHVRGTLSESERARFETKFLESGRRRDKWEAQRAIAEFFRARARPENFLSACARLVRSLTPAARVLLASSALVLIAGVGVLGRGYFGLRREGDTLRSRVAALERQAPGLPMVATFVLRAERLKSGPGNEIQIGSAARWVLLHLDLPAMASGYSEFDAALSTPEGLEIWHQNGLKANAGEVEIGFPAQTLSHGDYVLSISANEGRRRILLPSYQFRVSH